MGMLRPEKSWRHMIILEVHGLHKHELRFCSLAHFVLHVAPCCLASVISGTLILPVRYKVLLRIPLRRPFPCLSLCLPASRASFFGGESALCCLLLLSWCLHRRCFGAVGRSSLETALKGLFDPVSPTSIMSTPSLFSRRLTQR